MQATNFTPCSTGAVEELLERHATGVLGGLPHHGAAGAGEVHLGEAELLRALGHHPAEHRLQGALLVRRLDLLRLAQDVEAPEGAEDGDVVAHGGGAVGDDEGRHDLVEIAAEQDDGLLGGVHQDSSRGTDWYWK